MHLIDDTEPFAALLRAAQAVLAAQFPAVWLGQAERLTEEGRRNLVLRCQVAGDLPGTPTSIIIKQVVAEQYDPTNRDSWDTQRFMQDWYGAQFLSRITTETPHSPRFYAGDTNLGFVLLEDLGAHASLVEPLLGSNPYGAQHALLLFAARLGAMHADTIGKAEEFEQLTALVNPHVAVNVAQACQQQAQSLQAGTAQLLSRFEQFGAVLPSGLLAELEMIYATIAQPGAFLAYIHGDPCPDNVFLRHGALRLIDFEFGSFGHALRDAAYGRMFFPTCWCANQLPRAIIADMEEAYREELGRTCPETHDDLRFEQEMMRLCAAWLLETLAWQFEEALLEDQTWGIASVRSRILARLQAFSFYADQAQQLPALSQTARDALSMLQQRWPETPTLAVYPAFDDL